MTVRVVQHGVQPEVVCSERPATAERLRQVVCCVISMHGSRLLLDAQRPEPCEEEEHNEADAAPHVFACECDALGGIAICVFCELRRGRFYKHV